MSSEGVGKAYYQKVFIIWSASEKQLLDIYSMNIALLNYYCNCMSKIKNI